MIINYNVKNVGYIETLEDAFKHIDNDIYSCCTLSDIITTFNFWYGFLQGWFNQSSYMPADKERYYNRLKDSTLEMVFVIDGGKENV